ncbi:Major facilitator superfamily MFS_1 [Desulfamplus magnetovallimortis]|uniref:Major facilitator superfamily MFS_1 n=1 Tax=Desulfamplus magnetovallimortis TaxID=1246637 RepID=A0A1W1HFK0_9BACT|nr:MFS transporter [Desulfamplus magnetovallimortis]SLM31250.1 Major facilitator superfamily MFS_1 [Desulfamplus magnetovallimortis]
MKNRLFRLQIAVFALVSATFTNIYITQPILPVLQDEFSVSPAQVSMTVSIVILGIVFSNLLFGYLADRFSIRPIILTGGICVAIGGMISSQTHQFNILLMARMFQGLFIPALTTSLAAWLAKTLPKERLKVIMGSYVAATVLGGLGGRLLGGWIHPPFHWRYAMISASVLVIFTMILALIMLPKPQKSAISLNGNRDKADLPMKENQEKQESSYLSIVMRKELFLIYACGAGGLMMFQPLFNFLSYRLAAPPFSYSTETITLVYLVYALGIFLGPMAGQLSNKLGGGNILIAGSILMGISFILLLLPSITAVLAGVVGVCAGFFSIHAVAVGLLNEKLTGSQGKANAVYVLFYYTGGWLGITGAGFTFEKFGWYGVIGFVVCFLAIPLATGINERNSSKYTS